ncbi:reverse transcriptase family protein [Mucilaginibacter sp. SP1R1]|uniref:reverse transcriptase family protein n=1 Tax=Mucilaginibacter sp. SP1R1 TaxID=2723091 RepID=UPI001619FDDB|nr:reverse transcriptase family protein [Mucilaginibacter sp. SP1R1]MBB6150477.1 RNA-directed DNA polymerase [Mucilaginibacter sp. SP1R1]
MNFQQYSEAFRKKALAATFSEDEIIYCLDYAKPIIEKGLPVVYNTTHLAALVGYRKVYLKKAVLYTSYFYRRFVISKRNGKPRTISEPLPSLKEIQIWILKNILENLPVSKFAKAYLAKKDVRDNVRYHIGKPIVLKLDIKDFFGSITQQSVQQIFLDANYSSNIANLFSKLCTLRGTLPQGASTSPYLSNLFMNKFDEVVGGYAIKEKTRYTRYADDLTFSGNFNPDNVIEFVQTEIEKIGLRLNLSKTAVMRQNSRQFVTGIVVNEKMQVPKKDRQNLRLEMHFIQKFGLENHLRRVKNKKANYLPHIIGRINYFITINPDDEEFVSYKKYLIETYVNENLT